MSASGGSSSAETMACVRLVASPFRTSNEIRTIFSFDTPLRGKQLSIAISSFWKHEAEFS